MNNTFGRAAALTIFGESHGRSIGAVLDGLPAGEAIDWEAVGAEMARRAPGKTPCLLPGRKRTLLRSKADFSTAIRRGRRYAPS